MSFSLSGGCSAPSLRESLFWCAAPSHFFFHESPDMSKTFHVPVIIRTLKGDKGSVDLLPASPVLIYWGAPYTREIFFTDWTLKVSHLLLNNVNPRVKPIEAGCIWVGTGGLSRRNEAARWLFSCTKEKSSTKTCTKVAWKCDVMV